MQLPPMWQITPLAVLAVLVGIAHEVGLRRLASRQTPEHRRAARRRSWAVYGALAVLIGVVTGPLDRWAMSWLTIHMVIHVVEMFYLPPLLIIGGAWLPLVHALPVTARRSLLRAYYRSPWLGWLRRTFSFIASPIVAVVIFNAVMVTWHIPAVFDWASWHGWVMNWLMAPSFILTGYLFWRAILPSHPSPPRASTRLQIAAVVVTAFEMVVLAMALAIFTKSPWYTMNVDMLGPARALKDQHWAAAVLWICGDLWAIPALVLIGHRIYGQEGSVSSAVERWLGHV